MKKPKNIPTYYTFPGTKIFRDTTALPFADGGPLHDRDINGKLLNSTYASPLGSMFREGGPFGEDRGTFDYAKSIYASQLGDYYKAGGMLKRADGSYSQRGLWDNIRANAGSGKKPTKAMLAQEKKINKQYAEGGPLLTKLTPAEEKQFQKFYQSLPDNLQSDDDTYDIRGYWDSEGRPETFDFSQPKENDGYYHAYSISGNTGEYLKSPAHETFQHAIDEDRKIGYRPVTNVYGRNIAVENESIIPQQQQSFLANTQGPVNFRTGGQFPRPYSLPEDSFKQGGRNLHNSVYASSNAQYPAVYNFGGTLKNNLATRQQMYMPLDHITRNGGSILSMSNTPELSGEGKDLTVPKNSYYYANGGSMEKPWLNNLYPDGGGLFKRWRDRLKQQPEPATPAAIPTNTQTQVVDANGNVTNQYTKIPFMGFEQEIDPATGQATVTYPLNSAEAGFIGQEMNKEGEVLKPYDLLQAEMQVSANPSIRQKLRRLSDSAIAIGRTMKEFNNGKAIAPTDYTEKGLKNFISNVKENKEEIVRDRNDQNSYAKAKEEYAKGNMTSDEFNTQFRENDWGRFDVIWEATPEEKQQLENSWYGQKDAAGRRNYMMDMRNVPEYAQEAVRYITAAATGGASMGPGGLFGSGLNAANFGRLANLNAKANPISWLPKIPNQYIPNNVLGNALRFFNTPAGQVIGAAGTIYGGYDAATNNFPNAYKSFEQGNYGDATANTFLGLFNSLPFAIEGVNALKGVKSAAGAAKGLTGEAKAATAAEGTIDDAARLVSGETPVAASPAGTPQINVGGPTVATATLNETPLRSSLTAEELATVKKVLPTDTNYNEAVAAIRAAEQAGENTYIKDVTGPLEYKTAYSDIDLEKAAQMQTAAFEEAKQIALKWGIKNPDEFARLNTEWSKIGEQIGQIGMEEARAELARERAEGLLINKWLSDQGYNAPEISQNLLLPQGDPLQIKAVELFKLASQEVRQDPNLIKLLETADKLTKQKEALITSKTQLQALIEDQIDPTVAKKIEDIFKYAGNPIEQFNPANTKNMTEASLVRMDPNTQGFKNLQQDTQDYVNSVRGSIGGTRMNNGDTFTLGSQANYPEIISYQTQYQPPRSWKDPSTWFKKPPVQTETKYLQGFTEDLIGTQRIKDVGVHETGHDIQAFRRWIAQLQKNDPNFNYYTGHNENPLAAVFKTYLVEPKIVTEGTPVGNLGYTYETWRSGVGELHSDLMIARNRAVSNYINNYDYSIDEAIALVKQMELSGDENLFNFYLSVPDVAQHFKASAPYDIKKQLLQFLPAAAGAIFTGASLNSTDTKNTESVKGLKNGGYIALNNFSNNNIKKFPTFTNRFIK